MKLCFVFLLTLALSGIAMAQALSIEDVRPRAGWKARLYIAVDANSHVKISGDETKITGTNINFTVLAEFPPVTPEDPPPPEGVSWDRTYVDWIDLKIGNEPIPPAPPAHTWEPGQVPKPGDPPGTTGVSHALRFASTKFSDGASAAIELKARFRVVSDDPPLTDFVEFSVTLPLKVYNKVIGLTTVEEWIPTAPGPPVVPGHYSKPGDADYPNPANVADTAKRIVDDAIVKLAGTAMKHALVADNGDGRSWRESHAGAPRLDEKMCLATLFFACTHGEISLWRASHTDELTYSPAVSNDVKTYVTTKPGDPRPPRDVPDYTLAFFYACETLYNTENNPRAFQLSPDVDYPNKGYAGFTAWVSWRLNYPNTETLDEHSKKVLEYMAAGDPLKIAIDKTQTVSSVLPYKIPANITGGPLLMIYERCDKYARIVNVYLNESEYNTVSKGVRDSWYWVRS